ncbi:hypothetical protein AMS68_000003 [Peltaster fructicola]|uniref:Uncharacterized protein n=1 Tax=Peltaster fructicola TaxID=286661 RepID=A0A6H0XIE2_9PEZI|nr:hypothetical protein AMS68_000003 [Peltaster fructicola]
MWKMGDDGPVPYKMDFLWKDEDEALPYEMDEKGFVPMGVKLGRLVVADNLTIQRFDDRTTVAVFEAVFNDIHQQLTDVLRAVRRLVSVTALDRLRIFLQQLRAGTVVWPEPTAEPVTWDRLYFDVLAREIGPIVCILEYQAQIVNHDLLGIVLNRSGLREVFSAVDQHIQTIYDGNESDLEFHIEEYETGVALRYTTKSLKELLSVVEEVQYHFTASEEELLNLAG